MCTRVRATTGLPIGDNCPLRVSSLVGVGIGLALVVAACGSTATLSSSLASNVPTTSESATSAAASESLAQRDVWTAHQIDTYHFSMHVEGTPGVDFEETDGIVTEDGCRVEGPFRVTVENNRVTELRDHGSRCPLDASDDYLAWIPFTIDAAFDLIEQVADPESLERKRSVSRDRTKACSASPSCSTRRATTSSPSNSRPAATLM